MTATAPATIDRAITTPSNLHRRLLCPGSARLEKGLSDLNTSDAARGRLFHKYWSNPNYERALLTPDERELLETSDRLLADVLGVLNFEAQTEFYVEQTISTLDGRLTGTPDRVYIWQQRRSALVADLKSGFAVVERAELNLQLRGYAVLVTDGDRSVDRVYVSILQPRLWLPSDRVTLAQYDLSDIVKARKQIDEIIDRTEDPKAPLVAGEDQCRYCKAKLICPAFRKALRMPLAKFKTDAELSKAKRDAEIAKRIKRCSDTQLEKLYEAVRVARVVDDAVITECRDRIKAGHFTNFVLGKDYDARSISNVRKAISMLALSGIASREEIIDLCTLSLRTVEDKYRSRKGGTWKQARDKIDRVLKSVIAREPRDPKILPKETHKKK
jgi:CRISPR/Cas system-associated exonuclease Cas4 (RecB family)